MKSMQPPDITWVKLKPGDVIRKNDLWTSNDYDPNNIGFSGSNAGLSSISNINGIIQESQMQAWTWWRASITVKEPDRLNTLARL